MTGGADELPVEIQCRRIIRAADRAALATTAVKGKGGVGGPWPYTSLVLAACDHDISPLLLISDLADHTRNLKADPRVSLLYDGTGGLDEPMAGPRIGLQGEAEMVEKGVLLERYLRRHPSAEMYAGFTDFHLFRVRPTRAHLVAGFGRISWIEAVDLMGAASDAFVQAEPEAVARLNADHGELLDRCAQGRSGRRGKGWRAVGLDPEGVDIRCGGRLARLDFAAPIAMPDAAPGILRLMAGRD